MKKIISVFVCAALMSQCSPRNFNNSSETKDEASEEVMRGTGIVEMYLASSALFATSSHYRIEGPMQLTYAFGVVGTFILIDGLTTYVENIGYVTNNNYTVNMLIAGSTAGSMLASLNELAKLEANPKKDIALVFLITSAAIEFTGAAFKPHEKPTSHNVRMAMSLVQGAVKNISNASAASKNLLKKTLSKSETKQETRALEAKFGGKAESMVASDGKVLDNDLLTMAILSEVLQKKSLNTKDFARQVSLAFSLPYDAPKNVLSQNKVTDPIAVNIFENRSKLRQVGLM